MPFEGEPPNGDYAGYIDRVINRGQGTPGEQRLFQAGSGGVRARKGLPELEKGMLGPGEQASAGTGMPSALVAPAPPSANTPAGLNEPAPASTLAAQRRNAVGGLAQTAIGGLFALAAIGNLIYATQADSPTPQLILTVIFFVAARNLLKAGFRKLRGSTPATLAKYPPLKARGSSTPSSDF